MKKYFILILLLFFSAEMSSANVSTSSTQPMTSRSATPQPDTISLDLEKGKDLASKGELLQAREFYNQILENQSLSEVKKQAVLREYEAVNLKLIFSTDETPESSTHIVKPGDSLYKIAKKYGTTIELVKKTNGLTRDTIYPKQKLKVITAPFSILVDKSDNKMVLSLNNKPVKTYNVATGRDNITPVGKFKIVNKLKDPTWYKAGAVVPPDSPENELGTRWLGFDIDSYGIHGTVFPESIGKQATSGCVRMLNEEVEEVFSIVPVATPVTIVD